MQPGLLFVEPTKVKVVVSSTRDNNSRVASRFSGRAFINNKATYIAAWRVDDRGDTSASDGSDRRCTGDGRTLHAGPYEGPAAGRIQEEHRVTGFDKGVVRGGLRNWHNSIYAHV